jgi:hypothetical protein
MVENFSRRHSRGINHFYKLPGHFIKELRHEKKSLGVMADVD